MKRLPLLFLFLPVLLFGQVRQWPVSAMVKSSGNSTTSTLTAGSTFTGTGVDVLGYHQIHFTLFFRPNVVPSGDGSTAKASLFFEFSPDNSNWDISVPIFIRSGINIPQTLVVVDRYFRVRYVNDGGTAAIAALGLSETAGTPTNQTAFRLNTYLVTGGTKDLGRTIDQGVSGSDPVSLTRAVIMGKDAANSIYRNVGVNSTGNLLVADFLSEVAEGTIPGYSLHFQSGYNPDIDAAAGETVADAGLLYTFPTSAAAVSLVSTSLLDNGTVPNTGARTVTLEGLDANYAEITETVTLNGIVAVNSSNSFLRINNAYVETAGATGANQGSITATITAAVQFMIPVAYNRAQLGFYTVPAGKTGYLLDVTVGLSNNSASNLHGLLYIREFGGLLQVRDNLGGHAQGSNGFADYKAPIQIPEKSDIRINAEVGANNTAVNCQFSLLLVAN